MTVSEESSSKISKFLQNSLEPSVSKFKEPMDANASDYNQKGSISKPFGSKSVSPSSFVQQLEHETGRIKDIIKKPKLVETKFKTLINLHEGIESMINEYVRTSGDDIRIEVEDILKKWCCKFRNEWKADLGRLDELNMKVLKWNSSSVGSKGSERSGRSESERSEGGGNNYKNIKVMKWKDVVQKTIENIDLEVDLFDESIYGEMNEYIDVNLKKEDLERKEVKEMIMNYNELREEVEDGLDEVIEEVKGMEKRWMKVRGKLEEKGKKWLEVLYVCYLNYLDGRMKKVECRVLVNGEKIEGKMMDGLKKWLEE